MEWTLLVPGALLPANAAPSLAHAAPLAPLLERLATARPTAILQASEACRGAAHWSWLARQFALPADPPVTAPYAWFGAHAPAGAERQTWIAHADPVHMALGRDHVVIGDIGEPALADDEVSELLASANAALAVQPGVRLVVRAGRWYLLADSPWRIQAPPLDAALGRAAQHVLPEGPDARRWRVLGNEIQMCWHAAAVNEAREQRGARPVNGIWLHGGGRWAPLPDTPVAEIRAPAADALGAVLHGWHAAAGSGGAARVVSVFGDLRAARARQDWDAWLFALAALAQRVDRDLDEARARGAAHVELVLCGEQLARGARIDARRGGSESWWRRALGRAPRPAAALERWLVEGHGAAAVARA